jgi:hypothetical protein
MRYSICVCAVLVVLTVSANAYCQVERVAQTETQSATRTAEGAKPCPPTGKASGVSFTRSVLALRYTPGQTLIVRLNNQRERVGKLTRLDTDYLVLTSSSGARKIAYEDVASLRKWSVGWRLKRVLMATIHAPERALVYGGFYTLVGIGTFLDWITGHR